MIGDAGGGEQAVRGVNPKISRKSDSGGMRRREDAKRVVREKAECGAREWSAVRGKAEDGARECEARCAGMRSTDAGRRRTVRGKAKVRQRVMRRREGKNQRNRHPGESRDPGSPNWLTS